MTPEWFVAPQSIVRKIALSLNTTILREKQLLLESWKAMNGKVIYRERGAGGDRVQLKERISKAEND